MKNTMKKLLSLVLVAMLLVSAIPFQAAAAEGDYKITFEVKTMNKDNEFINIETFTDATIQNETTRARNLLTYIYDANWESTYECTKVWSKASGADRISLDDEVPAGDHVAFILKEKGDTRVAKEVPVKIYVDNTYVRDGKITVPVDGSTKLTKELGESLVQSDKTFVKWTGASDNEATDVTIQYDKITDGYYVKLFVATKKDTTETVETVKPITVKIVDAKGTAIAKEFQITPANGKSSVVGDILTQRWMGDWKDSYEFVSAKSTEKGTGLTLSSAVNAGDTLTVTLKAKSGSSDSGNSGSSGTNNKFPYKVYLHIFKDNKIDEPNKTINITEGIALDGKVTLDEVKTVVKNYYTAKTSDGIKYDGMYLAEGNWVGNFVNDTHKYTTLPEKATDPDINEMRKTREVHINVMITNANAKSSETADTSNPKTGDTIFVPVIFMVVSGTAIAAAYIYSKKRIVK